MKLEDPSTLRLLKIISIVVLVVLVALEPLVEHHPHFGIDGSFAFSAWFGFASCVAMVFVSKKIVGAVLKRKDSYYND